MNGCDMATDHPKRRRRRRRADRSPLSGWLTPSDDIKGNIGTISDALFAELFGSRSPTDPTNPSKSHVRYVATTPWYPVSESLIEDVNWTILPVQARKEVEDGSNGSEISSIHFPRASLALQGLLERLQESPFARSGDKGKRGIEVRLLDVEPLSLETVYVTVDRDALDRHIEMQKKFGGGFDSLRANTFAGKGKGKAKVSTRDETNGDDGQNRAQDLDTQLISAIREALALSIVARQDDLLPLPLPVHPITHVPLPPAKITLCEPLRQGLIQDSSRIVVNRVSRSGTSNGSIPTLKSRKALLGIRMEDGNDTSNDQFYSAAENDEIRQAPMSDAAEPSSSSSDVGSDSDDSTGESMQNMISISSPRLPNQNGGILSSKTGATPRQANTRTGGIRTPGSVISNFTATTARQSFKAKPRSFRAKGLSARIPDELLHPRPTADEDEEARVFVDLKILLKIGCFSGDWVQVAATSARDRRLPGLRGLDFGALDEDDDSPDFRPAKIYGLSNLSQSFKPRLSRGGTERRSSILEPPSAADTTTTAWVSPLLLANLGETESISITPLLLKFPDTGGLKAKARKTKVDTTSSPPIAKEMTFTRIATPLSTERTMQAGIFAAMKHYFEVKKRVLRQGDLIALPIDISLSRLLAQPVGATDGDHEMEELLSLPSDDTISMSPQLNVAWFRVGQISLFESEDKTTLSSTSIWGGLTCIDPMATRMRQVGSESCRIPSTLYNPWQSYTGTMAQTRRPISGAFLKKYVSPAQKQYVAPQRRRIRELMAAATSPRALHLGMDPVFILLHSTQRNIGKATLTSSAASDLGLHVFDLDAHELCAEGGNAGDIKTEATFRARIERALTCGSACTTTLIRHVDTLTADRMVTAFKEILSEVRVIIATTNNLDEVADGIRSLVTHELEVSAPDEGEREGILRSVVGGRSLLLGHNVDLSSIALKTAALVAGDLVDIIDRASVARQSRLEDMASIHSPYSYQPEHPLIRDVMVSGGENAHCVIKADFDLAVEAARKNFADAIGAPKIPNVGWDDVGGLGNVKDAVMETIQLPLERPELFAKGMKKRSGILFYGPPGTGKTLLAKAIATEFSLNFFSVKGPELLNMYIGESEANVRRVFQRARDARPCVVFFDELDSVAPKRGNQGDSGGVMDRIVSQLLAELDGMSNGEEGGGGVFVIGATNRPDLLDQALLRPGRFDKMLYLGVSDTHAKQLTILEALTRKFTMHPETSLQRVAESLPFTYTGADLYALCSDAMLKAITRQAAGVDAKIKALPNGPVSTAYFFDHLATDEDIAVMVGEKDFFAAQKELVGSVSAKELEHYHYVRQTFESPSKSQASTSAPPALTRLPTPGHLEPPVLNKRPNMNSRSSTKVVASPNVNGKGKGKASKWDSDDDDDDDAYVTSNDFAETPERRQSGVNGSFHQQGMNDDDELYQ